METATPAPTSVPAVVEHNSTLSAAEDTMGDANRTEDSISEEISLIPDFVVPTGTAEPTAIRTPETYINPELTEDQLVFQGLLSLPEEFTPLASEENGPVYLYADFDGNLLEDIAFIGISAGQDSNITWEYLSDYSRLYDKETSFVEFYLYPFYQTNGTILAGPEVLIRRDRIIGAQQVVPLHNWYSLPKALSFRFPTLEGINEEWIIFTGNQKYARLTLKERPNVHYHIDDIDDDGYYEIILSEQVYEEGRGYETFVTWLRWTESGFEKYRYINVVRNLKAFLELSKQAIISYNIEGFITQALADYDESIVLLDGKFWDRVFISEKAPAEDNENSVKQEKLFSEIINEKEILSIYFPDVMENPFELGRGVDSEFPILTRIVSKDGEHHYFSGKIKMLRNPFGEKQFSFVLDAQ